MSSNQTSRKALLAVGLSVVLVVVCLLAFFITRAVPEETENIVLPTHTYDAETQDVSFAGKSDPSADSVFIDVRDDNVLDALQSLIRPVSYHQTYSICVGSDDATAVGQINLWVNRNLIHAEISDGFRDRTVISDGKTVYMWYAGEEAVMSVDLEERTAVEDFLGIPRFDAYLRIGEDQIVETGYLFLEEPGVPCIYVCRQVDSKRTERYWISLESGLLYQSDVLEESVQVYTARQLQFEELALEDESFSSCFILPDHTRPFAT